MHQAIVDALYFVAQKGWSESPHGYFHTLVSFLAQTLEADFALVAELQEDGCTARTVGLYSDGHVAPNFDYPLAGTPCENVIGKALCCYEADVQRLFPHDRLLVEMGADSYAGNPLWSATGEPIGLIAVLWREPLSSERRRTTEGVLQVVALRCAHELDSLRQESRLREYGELLHGLTDGFYFVDRRGRFLDVNSAYCSIVGYDSSELRTMSVFDLEATESADDTNRRIASIIATGYGRFESCLRRKDGRVVDVEITAQYWPSGSGRFAVMVRDITERRKAEQERKALESQLIHAHKLEAVGRLAGGIAHDFNNMLAVILGQAELLLGEPTLTPDMRQDILEIRDATERSAALTGQLLTFARKQPSAPKVLNLNAAIPVTLEILRRTIGEQVEFAWLPMDGLWNVRIDPSQLDQAVTHLCVNARDAMKCGGKIVLSTCHVCRQQVQGPQGSTDEAAPMTREYVCLCVCDNGCGMDEETRNHVFEPFFSTKGTRRGSGLGLATVYGIVTQSGGFVEVESSLGAGSTFRLYLPRCSEEVPSLPVQSRKVGTNSATVTVLLVEDDPRVIKTVFRMLQTLGYRVFSANGPIEALALLENAAFDVDLLLTDVIMPDMHGRQLCERVRACRPEIHCLYMSGYSAEVISRQGILEEGTHLLHKPFGQAELDEAIQSILADGCFLVADGN